MDPIVVYEIFEAALTEGFPKKLLDKVRTFDDVQELFGYEVDAQQRVRPLLSAGVKPNAQERVTLYSHSFHNSDPLMQAGQHHVAGVHIKTADLPADTYRSTCFDAPGFVDKISFTAHFGGTLRVLSFYRGQHAHRAIDEAWQTFGQIALAALLRYQSHTLRKLTGEEAQLPYLEQRITALSPDTPLSAVRTLRDKLQTTYPQLSPRENYAIALSLAGLTIETIAHVLDTEATTVVTFRKRACVKYGYKKHQEFVWGLLV